MMKNETWNEEEVLDIATKAWDRGHEKRMKGLGIRLTI